MLDALTGLTPFPFLCNLLHHIIRPVGVNKENLDSTVAPDLHPQPGLNRREFHVWLSGFRALDDADDNLGNARGLFRSVKSGDSSLDDGGVAARQFGAFQKTFRRVVGHGNPPALPFYGSSDRGSRLESRNPAVLAFWVRGGTLHCRVRGRVPSLAFKTTLATIEPCLLDNTPALDPRLQTFLRPHSPNVRALSPRSAASLACRRIRVSFPDSPSVR